MSPEIELVVNPKSLERQIKLLDERLVELREEMEALEKKREACCTLLGIASGPAVASAEPPAPKKGSPRKKKEACETEGADEPSEPMGTLDAALSPVSETQTAPASY
jgi:hypothetical protein